MKNKGIYDHLFNCFEREEDFNSSKVTVNALKAVLPQVVQSELTDRQRMCLQLRFEALMSQQEIAQRLGFSQPTVSRHLKKAVHTVSNRLRYCKSALGRANAEWLRYLELD